jgi:adenylate kinase
MMNLILIGPQGSGKGTQAEAICRIFGLTHVEMGSLIRKRAQVHDKKAELIDHLANKKGELLPDGIVLDMVSDELSENPSENGYLFDGFPRTVLQYQLLKELLQSKDMSLHSAIYLKISDAEAVKRMTARRLCEKCGKGYSLTTEPDRTTCDCGGNLIKRADDEPAAIAKRLTAFHNETQPILSTMKSDGILREIDGEKPVQTIRAEISRHLQNS